MKKKTIRKTILLCFILFPTLLFARGTPNERSYDADSNSGELIHSIHYIYLTFLNEPILTDAHAHSAHYGDDMGNSDYVLELGVQVSDPQGLTDISSVKVTGPGGSIYLLKDNNSNGWYTGWISGLSTPPQSGSYTFRATDKSGNWAETVASVTGYLDYPRNVHPTQNQVVSTSTPTFSWNAVQGAVTYYVWVNDNYGKNIWGRGGLTSTSVIFNDDGLASESLKDGSIYTWSVNGTDADGNWGEHYGRRFAYSTNLTKPIIINRDAFTYHGGDDRGNEDYGYDVWLDIMDPQGYGDISSVKFRAPGGIDYIMTDNNGDGRYEGYPRGLSAPSVLGQCTFTVTDKSNNTATTVDTLSAWIQYPHNIHPAYNEVMQTSSPEFHWDAVTGISNYQINVWISGGSGIWSMNIGNRTSVTYNENGTGQNLQDGVRYMWDMRTFDSKGNYGYHYGTEFVYSSSTASPVLNNPTARSAHYGDDSGNNSYYLILGIQIADPQGLSDIASIVVTGPDMKTYSLKDDNNDGYCETWFGGSTEIPQLGVYKFKVTDKSGNWTEAIDNLTANLDYPKNIHPAQTEVISTPTPTFSWDGIQGDIKYDLWVDDNQGKRVWWRGSLTSTSVIFNDDGSASENLKVGSGYTWGVRGYDADGNWGEQSNRRFFYSTNPTYPIFSDSRVRSRHWAQGDFSESWGIDTWIYSSDPQGLNDIDSVWVDGPENYHSKLYDDGRNGDDSPNDGKFARWTGGLSAPPVLGEYIFKVIDKSGNLVTVKDTLIAVLDYPKNVIPQHNKIVTNPNFTISWDLVEGAKRYEAQISSIDWSRTYWDSGRIPALTSTTYNADHTGLDLSDGGTYWLTIRTEDDENNESERTGVKIAYRISDRHTIYVDTSNTSGNETGAADFPFNTIIEGVAGSVTGDTVLVSPGIYEGSVENVGSINLIGENPVTTIIRGYVALRETNVKIKGFTITASDRTGIEIHENVLAEISNNIIFGNAGAGIAHGWGGSSSSIIKQNTILRNGGEGIAVQSNGSVVVISNNIIAYNNRGISLDADATITNSYNDYFGNPTDFNNLQKGTGEIFTDPKFINYAGDNFNLQSNSPCIDAGNPDLDGDGKDWTKDPDDRDPDTTRLDMGALYLDQRLLYPDAPVSLTAVSCNNLVRLNWSQNTSLYFLRYRIYGGTTNYPTTKIDSTTNGISDTQKVISGLIKGQTYYFRVIAVNRGGAKSDFSNQVTAKVQTGVVPRIKAKWKDVLICYNLGDSITSFQWFKGTTAILNATNQYFLTNKQAGTYKVFTIDKNGCLNVSNIISISGTKSLTAYPNPAFVSFSLKMNDEPEGRAVVSLINSAGIKVLEFQAETVNDELLKEIPVSNLDEGIYVVQVLVNHKDLYSTKIVVIK